ncbi:cytochrome P450 [Kitasatospora sp. NPDC101235]|uniref:cytochrome P450 n=1 Tax=Kitasatospora sp. NPDC101235 TaxID=3364101 RepID=UPI003807DB43
MSRGDKYRFAFRTLSFLNARRNDPSGSVELSSAPNRALLVWKPETIGQIFRGDRDMVLEGSDTLGPLVGEQSLLFANGPRHAAYRQVIGPRLRGRHLRSYEGIITAATQAAIDELAPGTVVPISEWTRRLTLGIVSQIILGKVDEGLLSRFTTWVEGTLGSRGRTLAYRYLRLPASVPSPWRTFQRRRADLDKELVCPVTGRTGAAAPEGEPTSLVDLLRAGGEPLGSVSDTELRDQIVSLLFAGHETTASSIAWALFWLERNDSVRRDVLDELAATSGDGSVAEDVPLLDAACREALRISPPAVVAGNRVLQEDREIHGEQMPAGTRLTPCIYLAHQQPDVYPEPERFDPQRFLDRRMSAQEYLPFGGGTRRCLGADLAMLEMRMIVAAVLRRRELKCVNPETGVPHLRGPAMGPGEDLRMVVTACPS